MRLRPALLVFLLVSPLGACSTVSPYGDDSNRPTAEAAAYAEALLARSPESLTEDEVEFLALYAQQAEARNVQARAQFEQGVFLVTTGLSLLSAVLLIVDRTTD